MRIPQPGIPEVVPPHPVQDLCSGRGGEIDVMYIRCIEGREPEVFELWAFAEDGIRKIHLYARVQISDDFVGETFYSHFLNAREIRIPFLVRRAVNGSVQWLDVPRAAAQAGSPVATWPENTFVYSWVTYPIVITPNVSTIWRIAIDNVPVNLHTITCRANHKHL